MRDEMPSQTSAAVLPSMNPSGMYMAGFSGFPAVVQAKSSYDFLFS
jgi:hypothetical protein